MSLSIELNTAIEKVDDMSNKINSILQRLPSRKYVHAAENIQKGNLKVVVHLAEHTLAEQTLSYHGTWQQEVNRVLKYKDKSRDIVIGQYCYLLSPCLLFVTNTLRAFLRSYC